MRRCPTGIPRAIQQTKKKTAANIHTQRTTTSSNPPPTPKPLLFFRLKTNLDSLLGRLNRVGNTGALATLLGSIIETLVAGAEVRGS